MDVAASVENKRKNLRTPLLVTKVKGEAKGNVFFGYAKNISRVGLFIQTVNPKKEKEQFSIEFTLPSTNDTILCAAEVVWKRDFMENAKYEPGMGLKFVDLESEQSEEIDRWVRMNS